MDARGAATLPLVPVVRRPVLAEEMRNRSQELQRCFDRLGDFDEDR